MADRGSYYPLTQQGVQWDPKGPYYNTSDGQKDYIPPISAAQYQDDPKMLAWAKQQGVTIDYGDGSKPPVITNNSVPGGGLFHQRGEWNSTEGGYDQGLDWGNILSMVVAGVMTAGAATAALGGTAAASSAVTTATATGSVDAGLAAGGAGAAAAATAAPAAATAGTIAGTTGAVGMGTLPAVAASGAVGAATGAPMATGGIMAFLNSPAGSALINGAGQAFSAYGQGQEADANRGLTAAQFAAGQVASQSGQDRQNAQAAATPLGENQNFAAKNALLNAILPNMRNISYAKGSQPSAQGGILPPGGLDKGMVDSLYGSTPTLESLALRQKQTAAINPQAPQDNLGAYGGFGDKAAPYNAGVKTYQDEQATKQDNQRSLIQQYINAGLSGDNGALQRAVIGTGGYQAQNSPFQPSGQPAAAPVNPRDPRAQLLRS